MKCIFCSVDLENQLFCHGCDVGPMCEICLVGHECDGTDKELVEV